MFTKTVAIASASMLLFSSPALAWCPWGENDYCVACPDGQTKKEVNCPGGEVGLVLKGIQYPSCSISYYSDQTCRVNSLTESPSASEPISQDPSVRVGIGMVRGNVVMEMSLDDFLAIKEDFQKLEDQSQNQ